MTASERVLPQTREELARRLIYANLAVDTGECGIRLLCLEAEKLGIPAVLVNPVNVALASSLARGSGVKVGLVKHRDGNSA